MGFNGSENFKTLLLQIAATVSNLSWISPNGPHKITSVIFEIWSFRFLTIFFENFKFAIVAYGEIKNLNYVENERS